MYIARNARRSERRNYTLERRGILLQLELRDDVLVEAFAGDGQAVASLRARQRAHRGKGLQLLEHHG